MAVEWSVTGNILADVCAEIEHTAGKTLDEAGEMYKRTAYEQCPVSRINTSGYVHLRDTIDYETDTENTFYQMWLTMYVLKNYAMFVNNGTSKMMGRPFFTNGILQVQDHYDEVIEREFADLRNGRAQAVAR